MAKTRDTVTVEGRLRVSSPHRGSRSRIWYGKIRDLRSGAIVFRGSTGHASKSRAREWLIEKARAMLGAPAVAREISMEDAMHKYIGTRVLRPATLKDYLSIARVIAQRWPTSALSELSAETVEEFLRSMQAAGRASRTRAKYLDLLRRVVRWGKKAGYTDTDPTEGIRVKSQRQRAGLPLTESEAHSLLAATLGGTVIVTDPRRPSGWTQPVPGNGHTRLFILLGLYTGIRPIEISRLRWHDVDLRGAALTVRVDVSKTHRERRIPLHPVLLEELVAVGCDSPSDPIFLGDLENLRRSIHRSCDRAGIARRTCQDMRRTFGTWMESRCSWAALQNLMGHSPSTVTQRYVSLPWESLVAAIGRLPDLRKPVDRSWKGRVVSDMSDRPYGNSMSSSSFDA